MVWEPLCEFLGVEVPEVAFPHLNSGAEAMKLEVELYLDRSGSVGRRFVRWLVFLLGLWRLLVYLEEGGGCFKSQIVNHYPTVVMFDGNAVMVGHDWNWIYAIEL
jgi:hypothetical protein